MRSDHEGSVPVRLLGELRRRKVIRVAGAYAVVAWVLIEVADTVFPRLALPEWTVTLVVALALLGFPVALVLAWALEMTPDGVKRTVPEDRHVPANAARRPRLVGIGGLAMLVALVGVAAYGWSAGERPVDRGAVAEGAPGAVGDAAADVEESVAGSIAVLPLENLSPDPDNAYFAAGVHEEVLTQLSKIGDLRVISRTSVLQYAGGGKSMREIAGELGATAIVEGSVQRAGERVRVTAQLIDAETDEHLWAESYDREMHDIFAIQSELALAIAEALHATLAPEERDRIENRPTTNMAAYELYLRSTELWSLDGGKNETALELLDQAIRLDPAFADAHAALAERYMQRVQTHGYPLEWADSGVAAATRAIELAPELASGYSRLGMNLSQLGRYEEANRAFHRALELSPSHARALLNLSANAYRTGRYHDALRWAERAFAVDPTSPYSPYLLALPNYLLGRDAEAERWLSEVFDLDENFLFGQTLRVLSDVTRGRDAAARARAEQLLEDAPENAAVRTIAADAALLTSEVATARRHYETLLRESPGQRSLFVLASYRTLLAYTLLRTGGDAERADKLLTASVEHARTLMERGNESPAIRLDVAAAHAIRGDADAAFDWLERAGDAGWIDIRIAPLYPPLETLHDDPRWDALLERMHADIDHMRRQVEGEEREAS